MKKSFNQILSTHFIWIKEGRVAAIQLSYKKQLLFTNISYLRFTESIKMVNTWSLLFCTIIICIGDWVYVISKKHNQKDCGISTSRELYLDYALNNKACYWISLNWN